MPLLEYLQIKKTGTLLYKDFANGDCGDAVKFVRKFKNLNSYADALEEIAKDMSIASITVNLDNRIRYKPKDLSKISIVRKPFNEKDIEYWKSFGISRETLDLYKVNSISKFISDGIIKAVYKKDSPMLS